MLIVTRTLITGSCLALIAVAGCGGRVSGPTEPSGSGSAGATITGTVNGGNHGPMAYVERSQSWGPTPSAPVRDALDVDATNVSQATIDPRRAHVACGATLNVTTDGPLTLTLAGCGRTQNFG